MSRRAERGRERGGGLWLLAAVAGGVFVAADDQTSVVTVLPALIRDVGLTSSDLYLASWVVNGYLLGYVAALPIVGRVADARGRGRVYAAALAVFALGSALVAAAPAFWPLVAARALQAVGGGAAVPVAMAIVVAELPPARRALGLGAIAAAAEAGALIGPLWGGAVTELLGWRWVFWLNVPLALPCLAAAWRLAGGERSGGRVDWPGAALIAAALAALTVAVAGDPLAPRPWPLTAALAAAALALGALFVARQRAAREPMVRLAMFAPPPVWAAAALSVAAGGGLIAVLIGVPLFVNLVLLGDPLDGGLTLLRFTAAVPAGAIAGGWIAGRSGPRVPALAGLLLGAAGFLGLAAWDASPSAARLTAPLLAGGLGFGLLIAPASVAVLDRVREGERAAAASWLTLARVAGMLAGAGLLASHGLGRFYARAGAIAFGSPDFEALVAEAQVSTFSEVWIAAAAAMLLAAVFAWRLGPRAGAGGAAWWRPG